MGFQVISIEHYIYYLNIVDWCIYVGLFIIEDIHRSCHI